MPRLCIRRIAAALAVVWPVLAFAAEKRNFTATQLQPRDTQQLPKSVRGEVSVIVKFDADSLAAYRGGVNGFAATNPQTTGAARLDMGRPEVRAYERYLIDKENNFEASARATIPSARIVHRFRKIIGGVSMVVPAHRIKDLAKLPGVKAVYADALLPVSTDRSPEFIGAPVLWNLVGGQGNAGEGVIVGMIDTGMWPEHPSVADDGSYPAPPAKWTSTACEFGSSTPGDAAFPCNNKLIGARRVMGTFDAFGGGPGTPLAGEFLSARDNNGHGSHTGTTAAGNANVPGPTGQLLSGVAPRAHLAIYKVCFTVPTGEGSCYTSDSAQAIEQAIEDGVDVMNFSIGGGSNPYSDPVSLAFLDAYAAGVFVAASAGNSGPGADTVEHREPWVTTAAATTDDKGFKASADLSATGGASLHVTGLSSTEGVGPDPVVLSSAPPYNDLICLNPAPAHAFDGKIVACQRGTNPRVAKGSNVLAGGAAGMILYNAPGGATDLDADAHALPAIHIDAAQGQQVVAFVSGNADPSGTIVGGANDLTGQGDVVADFSSRGGANQTLGVSKPDVGAPGVNILAANTPAPAAAGFPTGQLFQIISGTSMASPHVAGAGALLHQLHPDWTPGQIKSALMMTATTADTVKEDGVTPTDAFDIGSGRIDLTQAGKPGLTISETADNYVLLQDNLSGANYPSLYIPVLAGKLTVQRKLKSVERQGHEWRLKVDAPADLRVRVPHEVFIPGGGHRTIDIAVDASAVPLGETRFATLRLHSRDHDLAFPITIVRRQGGVTLNKSCDPSVVDKRQATTCTIDATNTTFTDQNVSILDVVPDELRVTSVTGASRLRNKVRFQGTLAAAVPPQVSVGDGSSPAGGYLPLSIFGIGPIAGTGDETITNFSVPAFVFAGQTYTQLGVVSDGYLVVGGGTGADVQFINQNLPDPNAPNNVLAPFWTDLDASAAKGGAIRIGILGDGVNNWIVVDWDHVPNFSGGPQSNTFEAWIGINGTQDITFVYDATSDGEADLLTVGAENFLGNSGANYFYNGTGTLPTPATQVAVTGAPGAAGGSHTITINAEGDEPGDWTNCAQMTSEAVIGTATSCVDGHTNGSRHHHDGHK